MPPAPGPVQGKAASPVCLLVDKFYHDCHAPSGVSSYLIEEERALQGRGWQVVPFATADSVTRATPWRAFFPPGHDYSRPRLDRHTLADAVSYVWNREAARQLERLLAGVHPRVAHLHNIYHHLTPSILPVLARHRVPILLTLHDQRLLCPAIHPIRDGRPCHACRPGRYAPAIRWKCVKASRAASLLAAFESWHQQRRRLYARHVSLFICPSHYLAGRFADCGFPDDSLVVVPNPVDLRSWSPAAVALAADGRDQAADGRDAYVYFGRLAPEKGLTDLLAAHARHEAQTGQWSLELVLIGGGPCLDSLRGLARRLGLRRCRFVGPTDGPTIRQHLRRARFTVLPSLVPENAPLAVLESLACGLPVVATDMGGIPELILSGTTGWLVPAGAPVVLAEAIRRAGETTAAQRRACRRWAEAHADPERHFGSLDELLLSLSRPGASRR